MKTKKLKKRSFVGAIALLVISAITLTSATFAWFSMGPKVAVEAMDLTVASPEGIQISANAETWTDYLERDQIFALDSTDAADRYNAYDGNNNFLPAELKPVSSAFAGQTGGFANFFSATVSAGTGKTALVDQSTATADSAGFVAFDIFLRANKDYTIYFDESTFEDVVHTADVPVGDQKATTALRFALQEMGNVAVDASAADAIALRGLDGYTMYEPNPTERSTDAAAAGNGEGNQANQLYVNSATPEGGTTDVDNGNKIITDTGILTGITPIKGTDDASAKTFELKAGITKFRVYIWMEGNDIDCRDSIGTSQLSATLVFNTTAPGTAERAAS